MYNLIVTGLDSAWDAPYFMLDEARFLEHTDTSIHDRFQDLDDVVMAELRRLPTIFAYEQGMKQPSRVGSISSIRRRQGKIRITFDFDPSIPPITSEQLTEHTWDFDVNRFEMNRSHWAVKDVDLSEALRESGIHDGAIVSAPQEETFSRGTIIKAAGLLQHIGHTPFDHMLLELGTPGLSAGRDQGALLARSNALAAFAIENPSAVTAEGDNIGDAIVRRAIERTPQLAQYPKSEIEDSEQLNFLQSLNNDGFAISDGQLQTASSGATSASPAVIGTPPSSSLGPSEVAVEIGDHEVASVSSGADTRPLHTIDPTVFQIPEEGVQADLVSIMMPFDREFDEVLLSIQNACHTTGLRGIRVDDVWEDSTVIQDVFSLIYQSRIVIVDLTNQNPNVFYETGIAHTLGKLVVPLTQNENDVPFDLRHHRYLKYLANSEGLENLTSKLESRLRTLVRSGCENGGAIIPH